MCSYLICKLIQTVDCGTHDIFIAKVLDAQKISNDKEMTYRYYHEVIKAVAPKNAPTYIEEQNVKKTEDGKFEKYKCIICGYIYDEAVEKVKFKDLPADWKCPICGTEKENFIKIQQNYSKHLTNEQK